MEKFWNLILVLFFATNLRDKAESVQLEETPLKIIDEIFGEGWWDNEKAEEWHKLTLEQNALHQIDQQNTQVGQIEPNSIDHSGQIDSTDQNPLLTETDHSGQIELIWTDRNLPLPESDHSDKAKNDKEQNAEEEQKRKIIDKFHAMKDKFELKGKSSKKDRTKIEQKIAEHLKVSRIKIYEWKKELGLSQKRHNFEKKKKEQKNLVEKFDQMKAELKRDGFKNSYNHQIDKTVAKELGISSTTIYAWKRELGQTAPNRKYPHSKKKELMKLYCEIKGKNSKISDKDIAKMLKIGRSTMAKWKRLFKRQQLHQNSVNGHSVEANTAENFQEIENSNLGSN